MTSKRRRKPPLEIGLQVWISVCSIEGFDNPGSDIMYPEDWKGRLRDIGDADFKARIDQFSRCRPYHYIPKGGFYFRDRSIEPQLYFTTDFFLLFRRNDIFCFPESLSNLCAYIDPTAYRHPVAYLQAVDAIQPGQLMLRANEFVQVSWWGHPFAFDPLSLL